jgi:sorting nexin-25
MKNLSPLPPKQINTLMKFKKDFVKERWKGLNTYLKSLIEKPEICSSKEFRIFLTEKYPNYNRNLEQINEKYLNQSHNGDTNSNNNEKSMNLFDKIFSGNSSPTPSLPDDSPIKKPLTKKNSLPILNNHNTNNRRNSNPLLFGTQGEIISATEVVIDLFIEIFELKEKNNWWRKQAIVLILQQIFGGTIERKITENIQALISEENILYILDIIKESIWDSNDEFITNWEIRSDEQKLKTKLEAKSKLQNVIPELLGNVVGKKNARQGVTNFFNTFQNEKLNQHVIYSILDEIIIELFPELDPIIKF